ncbi:MAG TPA: amidase family protein [Vicinamibacterales bacterium]|nr:amidase family protein [Vicinamibacterales bacterium]
MRNLSGPLACAALLALGFACTGTRAQAPPPFHVEEATIAQIHAAMKAGRLTCRALVERYLQRIAAYDKNGPAINSIIMVNPDALKEADALDRRFLQGGFVGPLHCIPMIIKDNYQTAGLQTTAGSLSLKGFIPDKDAFLVKRVKAAGAIVLAKANMDEFAFSPYETVSSILPGYTRNPYALDRVTAGSSGGPAAAVAASFGAVGLGTDTGNSIRGPASHQALVGIRATMGLTSRAGIVPLDLLADVGGPMARTVADAVAVFQVIVGYDPDDPATDAARGRPIPDYSKSLVRDGLRGARIGVLRQAWKADTADPEVMAVFQKALDDMRRGGATIIDPATVIGLDAIHRDRSAGPCMGFKYDINRYLAAQGDRVPVHSLAEIIKSGLFHPSIALRLERAEAGPENGPETPACHAEMAYRQQVRTAVLQTMDSLKLDAFVYPTWSNVPRLIGDLNTPAGDNSQFFSPTTGFPAIDVPMGYTRGGRLPAGLTLYGRPWDEATLFKLAYSYEQETHHRRPPPTTPPLR